MAFGNNTQETNPHLPKKAFFHKRRIIRWGILAVFLVMICSLSPLVKPTNKLTPSQAAQARKGASQIIKPLMSASEHVSIEITSNKLDAISDVVSYTVPAFNFRVNASSYGMSTAVTLTLFPNTIYLNAHCLLVPNRNDKLSFSDCKLGSLPVPGIAVEYLFKGFARVFFGKEALITFNNILDNATLYNDKVVVNFEKPENLKAAVEARLSDTLSVLQDIRQIDSATNETISVYLSHIQREFDNTQSTASLMGNVFALVDRRSLFNDPVDENEAALWALAISLGAPDLARIVGLPVDYSLALPTRFRLRKRVDLRLHFFVSVGLRLASEKSLSINIGKFKELLDSAQGGSGFSFVDLAADKAGVELADFILSSKNNALRVQHVLAGTNDENLFMPLIQGFPEGLNESEFEALFGSENDPRFSKLETKIDERIFILPIYQSSFKKRTSVNID